MKYLVTFDLETTGVNTAKDRIVQIGIQRRNLENGNVDSFQSLVNPEMEIPLEASNVHGITNEAVADAPHFAQLAPKVYDYFQDAFISGFNHENFDIPMIVEEFMRAGLTPTCFHHKKIIDVSNIYRFYNPRTLSACFKQYTGKELENAHDALVDVSATEHILFKMLETDLNEVCEPVSDNLKNGIIKMETLVKLSSFINENNLVNSKRIDFDRKFVKDENDVPIFNFGKNKGKPVNSDLSYLSWMLTSGDFTNNTKSWCRHFLEKK